MKQLFLSTFGQPRTGDVLFAQYVDETLKSVRTIVRGDPIPRLPPGIPLPFVGLYKHFGEELYTNNLDQDQNEFITYNAEDPNCSESVPLTQLRLKYHSGPYFGDNFNYNN
ncbi:hypothetical protein RhiirA1_393102 [Rhizophagus irregularis]|uniref:Fungal lipase-type domain-containing protein n=1 Tax=Rhizophagus irregularis TaxID=588596 RepID=A0A2I1E835_9GLOM|nr:hypothetical protein RhiirA1_393102 [Rhizophagus irregularis]PKY18288.1 hypothetical protein RhiirB3_383189 [Rhizophagus irregularis]CAB5205761.1 unnamed protein product [Rhizophagus irregularis]